ncbi:hypothetical protein EVJ58_g7052, partial [Rhodofomes roseus]
IKPLTDPFWRDLPYVNIYASLPPDILHQLYQGMVKHVIAWVKSAYGARVIDARIQSLPPNHNLRHFSKGISHLARVSGTEHQDICRVLLGTIIDLRLPGGQSPVRLIRAVRALLDFVYLAQLPAHTSTTLDRLDDALARFHANKAVFEALGIRDHFNFPKLHSLQHYVSGIKLFGTADGTNTAQSEHLHITLAKDPWRKSNRKDEYPQMTTTVVRLEQIHAHALYIQWRRDGRPDISSVPTRIPHKPHRHITRNPTCTSVPFAKMESQYGASDFEETLKEFIIRHKHPELSGRDLAETISLYDLPFRSVSVWHKVKFWNQDAFKRRNAPETMDVIHARPGYRDTQGRAAAGRFDTALVNERGGGHLGVAGHRVAQVRAVFGLSKKAHQTVFGNDPDAPSHFVYLEWFSRFKPRPEANSLFYRIQRSTTRDGARSAAIMPLENLQRSHWQKGAQKLVASCRKASPPHLPTIFEVPDHDNETTCPSPGHPLHRLSCRADTWIKQQRARCLVSLDSALRLIALTVSSLIYTLEVRPSVQELASQPSPLLIDANLPSLAHPGYRIAAAICLVWQRLRDERKATVDSQGPRSGHSINCVGIRAHTEHTRKGDRHHDHGIEEAVDNGPASEPISTQLYSYHYRSEGYGPDTFTRTRRHHLQVLLCARVLARHTHTRIAGGSPATLGFGDHPQSHVHECTESATHTLDLRIAALDAFDVVFDPGGVECHEPALMASSPSDSIHRALDRHFLLDIDHPPGRHHGTRLTARQETRAVPTNARERSATG